MTKPLKKCNELSIYYIFLLIFFRWATSIVGYPWLPLRYMCILQTCRYLYHCKSEMIFLHFSNNVYNGALYCVPQTCSLAYWKTGQAWCRILRAVLSRIQVCHAPYLHKLIQADFNPLVSEDNLLKQAALKNLCWNAITAFTR